MTLNILSIPTRHPYVQAVVDTHSPDIHVIDPVGAGKWWPHPAYRAAWWDAPERSPVDILHIHFGFEHLSVAETRDLVHALQRAGVPLVLTVHDIDNPHLDDQQDFHQQLGVLIDAASHLITLTQKAADLITQAYGRTPEVIAHPPIVDTPLPRTGERPAVFLKSLRANVVRDPEFYRALGADVYLHHDAKDTPLGEVATVVHQPMENEELYRSIAAHPVVVLPYLRGTHSGWLRMCRDLGVSVAVPDCGCYESQEPGSHGIAVYCTGDGDSAARAVADLLQRGAVPAPPVDAEAIRARHLEIYRQVAAQ